MEEEVGKKVTRLRRRLSVEADDVKSPATPLTPSKKRGGRLAAKPQLELIDENAADTSPKNTKKAVSKKVEVEEKAVTPSRRSVRIRSNTSLLSDTPTLEGQEDKGTPSRRSTRIRSNTSLVSETIQNFDSPRAKRAARRVSQAGSDNETPITPARSVRRTRKNSATLDQTVETTVGSSEALIKEVIQEETEKSDTSKAVTPKVESPVRKSPRLNRSTENKDTNENKENNPAVNISIKEDKIEAQDSPIKSNETDNSNTNNLSVSSSNLIIQLASEPQKKSLANKSTSNLEEAHGKGKRHRTKSWTTISSTPTNDTSFSSDSECVRKKNRKRCSTINNMSGSGDGLLNASVKSVKDSTEKEKDTLDSSKLDELNKSNTQTNVSQTEKYFEKAPSTLSQPLVYIEDSDSNSVVSEKMIKDLDSEDQCVPVVQHNLNNETSKVNLSYEPMDVDETMPTFVENDDSIRQGSKDLNMSLNKSNKSPRKSFTDLVINSPKSEMVVDSICPKVNHVSLENSNKSFPKLLDTSANIDEVDASMKSKRKSSISKNMDLSQEDEEMNLSQANTSAQDANTSALSQGSNKKSNKTKLSIGQDNQDTNSPNKAVEEKLNQSKRKSSNNSDVKEDSIQISKSLNKSQRKSVGDESHNTTTNENKSTLVISQIKDDSALPENINESNLQSYTADVSKNIKDKKNISLTYSTSTPLQQKSLKKLGAINTSIIAHNSSKIGKKDKSAVPVQEESSDEEASEDSDEESSQNKSNMMDDEAEEASDDYESGDSRDEEEREYEENNEILERGETLESEEDVSNDSDYEKGSFIVSSDEEDDGLLSGSGDDLSLSADELTMSAKSKKKYNERKLKEQKKASKEMFEARHKSRSLNESIELGKSKKNNRQRLDSSESASDDDIAPTKKNYRQRIDSTQDMSGAKSDAEISLNKKKKKVKRLSESVCEDTETNEKEITVANDISIHKIDPLDVLNVVKKEPKTPQKDFNISTVVVTNVEEIEEMDIDQNVSILNTSQKDPLQNTMAQEDNENDDGDDESISENEEIAQNYDSLLTNLKSVPKVKAQDTSLNLNKKMKQPKEPIVDQLNLTQVKQKKRLESADSEQKLNKSKNECVTKDNKSPVLDEDSSDSIDMRLLFPEDSNDSETSNIKNKGDNDNQDTFIPLKRSEAKTNILEDNDKVTKSDESVLNVSKKKNKRKSGITQDSTVKDSQPEENSSFFVDTTGTHEIENVVTNTSIRSSSKKKAKNNVSFSNNDDDKTTKSDESVLNVSKKKNKRKSGVTQDSTIMDSQPEENLSFFIDTIGTHETENNTDTNTSIINSSKKKKAKNNVSFSNNNDENSNDAPLEVSSRKQNVDHSFSTQDNDNDTTASSTKKKNKKKLNNSTHNEIQDVPVNDNFKKNDNARNSSINIEEIDDLHSKIMEGSKKKNKKTRNNSVKNINSDNLETITTDMQGSQALNISSSKKNQSLNSSKIIDTVDVDISESNTMEKPSKKRKRKSSANHTVDEITTKDLGDQSLTLKEEIMKNPKKIKIAKSEAMAVQESTTQIIEIATDKKSNKKKVAELQQHHESKKNKKRKEREDDDGGKISKISKQNSFDVPRLPSAILNQLDDKAPEVSTKPKVISTTSFTVETAKKRKNKPSNYLEESIYLNDNVEERKSKGVLKNPKVLPFIPTVATSDYGFTTNFNVNVIPQQTRFIAQSSGVNNFKKEYLQKAIKKLGTFEKYKKHRNIKLSKF